MMTAPLSVSNCAWPRASSIEVHSAVKIVGDSVRVQVTLTISGFLPSLALMSQVYIIDCKKSSPKKLCQL